MDVGIPPPTAGAPAGYVYDRIVQNLVLGAITAGAVILVVLGSTRMLRQRGRFTPLQFAIGVGIGLLGAFLVLVLRTDLIPDTPEDFLERLAVIAVTVVAVLGSWYRIARA